MVFSNISILMISQNKERTIGSSIMILRNAFQNIVPDIKVID